LGYILLLRSCGTLLTLATGAVWRVCAGAAGGVFAQDLRPEAPQMADSVQHLVVILVH